MGGDAGPSVVSKAASLAIDQGYGPLMLVGTEESLATIPDRLREQVEVSVATEVIGMGDSPARAARAKKDSSMHVGMRAVRDGLAEAFVTSGNSGAALAVGLITLKRIKGCDRPVIASVLPTANGEMVLLDLGANTEIRPAQYAQFAVLGAAYSSLNFGVERPRVGLLSNGTELTKGTDTLRTAHRLLSVTDLNYIGFVEGNSIPLGHCDVVVTDGFVGNVALKLSEGVIEAASLRLRSYLERSWRTRLAGWLLKRILKGFAREIDWKQFGGAPLLGLNGIVVLSHGRADAQALCAAIRRARIASQQSLIPSLKAALEHTPYNGEMSRTTELPWMRATVESRVIEDVEESTS
jgi:glycerol-3-phosphate acyltransferase PlsX